MSTVATYFPLITGVPLTFFWRKCMREPVCIFILAEVFRENVAFPEENAATLFELLFFFVESIID